jgi:transposase
VGLEKRNGRVYYYKSQRDGEKVRKVYVGAGEFAHEAAKLDEVKRRQREEEATYWREERERLERSAAFVREVESAVEVLTRAYLLASGFHQHKGQWRRQRGA